MTSGKILGKKLAQVMEKASDLETFMEEFAKKGRGYFQEIDYIKSGEKECTLRVYRSSFWQVVDGTAIDKIKNVGCLSENRFLEYALKESFPQASVKKIQCRREGRDFCEFLIEI